MPQRSSCTPYPEGFFGGRQLSAQIMLLFLGRTPRLVFVSALSTVSECLADRTSAHLASFSLCSLLIYYSKAIFSLESYSNRFISYGFPQSSA